MPAWAGEVLPTSMLPNAQKEAPVLLEADQLDYDQPKDTLTAKGQVYLEQAGQVVESAELAYDRPNDVVKAQGQVVYTDPQGQKFYAEEMQLKPQAKTGFAGKISTLMADGGRFAANQGDSLGAQGMVLKQAVYSPCNICDPKTGQKKKPLWQLRASKVVHDKKTKDIYYHNARLEVKGVPVAYVPYMSQPDPTVKYRSGFLQPDFAYTSKLGTTIYNSYYQHIAPNADTTIGLINTTKQGTVLSNKYRQNFKQGFVNLETSFNNSEVRGGNNDDTLIKPEGFRGHVFGNGQYQINDKWLAGFNAARTTDEYYLKDFAFGAQDTLRNDIYAERYSGRNYSRISTMYFQDLRPNVNIDQPDVLPKIDTRLVGDPNATLGGRWALGAQFLTLLRNGQQAVSRLSVVPSWRRDDKVKGLRTTMEGKLYNDVFWVRQPSPYDVGAVQEDETQSRMLPVMQGLARYPMIKPGQKIDWLLEPKVALSAAPNTNINSGIPNEDSRDVQLDMSNVFNDNRFAGSDRRETGSHTAYGLKFGGYSHNNNSGFVTVGQSYRLTESSTLFPEGSGLEGNRSDYVAQAEATIQDRYYLDYRTQINESDLKAVRHELQTALVDDKYELRASYIKANQVAGTGLLANRQQLNLEALRQVADNWWVMGSALQNLGSGADSGLLKSGLGVEYKNECVRVTFKAERDLTDRLTGGSDSRFGFSLGLKNFGGYDEALLATNPLFHSFETKQIK